MSAQGDLYLRTAGLQQEASSFLDSGVLTSGPLLIVDTAAARYGEVDAQVLLGLALVVQAQQRGHVGLDLERAPDALPVVDGREARAGADQQPVAQPRWRTDRAAWQQQVSKSEMVGDEATQPFTSRPWREGGTLLISRRMAQEQQRLAKALEQLAGGDPSPALSAAQVDAAVDKLLEGQSESQGALALRAAAAHSLTVITGGPGTGKTWSIKRLLAMLLQVATLDRPLRVVLAAPTGKAAVRMTEAMGEELHQLKVDDEIKQQLRQLPAQTVHKLLRIRPDSGSTRYGPDARLPADVVVVDEASMLDLVLMRKLVEAISPEARLVLLGDRDQLASVEAGTVLADIVGGHFEQRSGPLAGRVVPFIDNYRFKAAPTIASIAESIQAKTQPDLDRAVGLMTGAKKLKKETDTHRVTWLKPIPRDGRPDPKLITQLAAPYTRDTPVQDGGPCGGYAAEIARRLRDGGRRGLRKDQRLLLDALDRYRVLAVHRRGPLGVSGLLRSVGDLVKAHILDAWRERPGQGGGDPDKEQRAKEPLPTRGGLWLGQPVLVTRNAYDVDLRNGDIGLVLPTAEHDLAVVFAVSEAGSRQVRVVPIPRLPEHMGALAMTVHKSQGSQFEHVALVLAGRGDSPIQTRELVYTAVTRCIKRLSWVGKEEDLAAALDRPVGRISSLGQQLWE